MRPMLATPGNSVPVGGDWQHEVKWDGMRVLVQVDGPRVRVTSRTERDVTVAFPELSSAGSGLPGHDILLDGEVVVLNNGTPSFAGIAERFNVTKPADADRLAATAPVTLMTFDLLRVGGHEILTQPLRVRRELLEATGLTSAWVQVPPVFDDGELLLTATDEQGVEGIVSKRLSSPYRPGTRSPDWRKIVHRRTSSYVVGGWRPETDRAGVLGSLLIGTPAEDGLQYVGRIGSGLAGAAGAALLPKLRALEAPTSPFNAPVPPAEARGAHWMRPELVVDIEYHTITRDGRLRQPSWRGVRADLTPQDL
ncbi:non-homologous end-joining DNA ligase [Branchiibius sp. NY16-3462-2]|uniref:non-homologous end-joining DNA ligase n=1 Tax=Branchiibius sp. NY16-3462-2 TaxID=1807500 RepID=UPI0007936D9A|nr:non-homologous end-joining DNA ligase [Branchiibius sp. NY16-3462-2]KYH46256.1 DNA ligase [Branchiibius sp. NY16-3462-2]